MSNRPQRRAATEATAKIAEEAIAHPTGQNGDPDALARDSLTEALAPLKAIELDEYHGWVELESNPSFFNVMLRNLQIEDVKVQEVLDFDLDTVARLPEPVFGFILLYEYGDDEDMENEQAEVPSELWFARQTMRNGCATIALLNILMNAEQVKLGTELTELKKETKDLTSELRGLLVENNKFIRGNHNAFARRLDLLNDDLLLDNEFTDEAKRAAAAKRNKRRKTPARKPARKKKDTERGNHYKAYAPIAGELWELNGLENKPFSRGPVTDDDWIPLAIDIMREKAEIITQSSSNVAIMAVCQSPFAALRKELAVNVLEMSVLRAQELTPPPRVKIDGEDAALLAEYGLTSNDVKKSDMRASFQDRISGDNFGTQEARDLWEDLVTEQRRILLDYDQEKISDFTDEDRVAGRKKDYTPAIHTWILKLAAAGVLEDVISASKPS